MKELRELTLTYVAESSAERFGRMTALQTWRRNDAITYTELLSQSVNVAYYLHSRGIGKGDRLSLIHI